MFYCRSESPSQVFVFTLFWLFEILSQVPSEKWHKIILAYDNMCQLDSLKVAKKPLPLEPPYDQMWLTIQKVCIYSVFVTEFLKNGSNHACNLVYTVFVSDILCAYVW